MSEIQKDDLKRSVTSYVKRVRVIARNTKAQQGVVLFFSLIALVVMSLAAVALIRSVDTNSLIAGNLAFRRSATVSADSGTETAITWLYANRLGATLESSDTSKAYFATNILPSGSTDLKDLIEDHGVFATKADGTAFSTAGVDSQGNEIKYVVQRMCTATGPANATNCLMGPLVQLVCPPLAGRAITPAACGSGRSVVFRVTAKVTGPKNTISYIQAFTT